jgi:2-polyprenyl-3-methyl-5-hydroxy-6-metoxy-1,4-benzoquinol methylase
MQLFCPACENKIDAKLVSGYNYKHELFKNKKLYQCRVCGLIFVQPMPTFDELDFYYKNVWLKVEGAVPESKEAELVYQIQAEERVQYLSRHIKIPENVQILDIGSGYGYLYEAFQGKMREGIDFYATDPNQKNLKRLQEKGIRAFADIAEIKNRSFDLITLCSVLEHIPNPFSYLKMVLAYLKNDGCLFIDLPERDDTIKPKL